MKDKLSELFKTLDKDVKIQVVITRSDKEKKYIKELENKLKKKNYLIIKLLNKKHNLNKSINYLLDNKKELKKEVEHYKKWKEFLSRLRKADIE